MDHIGKIKRERHPRETANIFSVISFYYTLDIFKRGYKKDIEEQDLYEVDSDLKSEKIGDQLEKEWERQKNSGKYSLPKLLWNCYGPYYLFLGIIELIMSSIVIIIKPNAQSKIVKYFEPGQTELTETDAWIYGALLIGVEAIFCVYSYNYGIILSKIGIKVRTALCSLIYRKVLKLTPEKLNEISIGKVVTLMTRDVMSFENFFYWANAIWVSAFKAFIIFYLIFEKVGPAVLTVILLFLVVMPLQIYLGTLTARLRLKMCKKSDERIQQTQETLSSIKIIKMYTWEKFFNNRVSEARTREISSLYSTIYLKFVITAIGRVSSETSLYVLMMAYVWLGNTVNGEVVYFIQSCLHMLIHTLGSLLPFTIFQTSQLYASSTRIGYVLKSMESLPREQDTEETSIKDPRVILRNVSVEYGKAQILSEVNLNFGKGLTIVAGPVGSGKTILIRTILKDLEVSGGDLEVSGKISYASQDPWLFPSSIRQNILFGEKYEKEHYDKVVNLCALKYDFDLLEAGDSTIVEDRGMNLSKGQQVRVNLARAIYKNADIYLLDGCLAALDGQVSEFIFKECIVKFLKGKLVVLVTHNSNYLKSADNVILMTQGRIQSFGKPTEISDNDISILKVQNETVKTKNGSLENDLEKNELSKLLTENTKELKVYHESKKSGQVNKSIYNKYIKFGGGYFALGFIMIIFALSQFSFSYSDKLVSKWVNLELSIANLTENTPEYDQAIETRKITLYIYSFIIGCCVIFASCKSFAIFIFGRRAATRLHQQMLNKLTNATMEFFDRNFIGNILNRFSKDLSNVDEFLPLSFSFVLDSTLAQIGVMILIASVNAGFLIPAVIFIAILLVIRWFYLPTGRSLQRLDALTRSPLVGHVNTTLEGLTTIKAFKAEHIVRKEFDRHQDLYTSATYTMQCCNTGFAFILDIFCVLFCGIVTARFLIANDGQLSGDVGLVISQAIILAETLHWCVRQWADIENMMTSVERVLEYTDVKQETSQGSVLGNNWPTKGEIRYENVSLTYTNSTERVLKNINFLANPKEKIGIVGRTGAGKSSIISTLFRLYEVDGKISIDGVDTKTLSLEFLRSKISIIPQDPILFSGTIRDNIDPTRSYLDDEIWHAVQVANLKPIVSSLDLEVTENGSNFSIGQKQLFCLARAIIRRNKIVVLDEATANMDEETDRIIHETIDKNFANCTVLTIAHKLNSITNCDKVIVMDNGEIKESVKPRELLLLRK